MKVDLQGWVSQMQSAQAGWGSLLAFKVGRRKHNGTEIRVGLNPSLTLTPCMTLSESLVLLKSQFHHLQNEGMGKKNCLPGDHEDAKRNEWAKALSFWLC